MKEKEIKKRKRRIKLKIRKFHNNRRSIMKEQLTN